jgi:lysophospholipase
MFQVKSIKIDIFEMGKISRSEEIVKKQVLVLYVGGTIGMKKNDDGVYVPVPHIFYDKLKSLPEMHDSGLATKYFPDLTDNQLVLPQFENNVILYQLVEYDPLLDSSNLTMSDWIKMANDIKANYNDFNGIVILHGTDTLAYTSSVLSFMIKGLQKPVIVTGAQISIFEIRSDAINNIQNSLILAGCYQIPEICAFFDHKLLRGNRTTKVRLTKFNAYRSPNYGPLANAETAIELKDGNIMKPDPAVPFEVTTTLNSNVRVITFFPTITPSMLESVLQEPTAGVVIQSYGAGNIPSNQPELIDALKKAVARNVLIVNITVCLQGSVVSIYDTGKVLADIGVISGRDMTLEAALTKLCVVLGYPDLSHDQRVELLKQNMRGELTPLDVTDDNNNNNNNNL